MVERDPVIHCKEYKLIVSDEVLMYFSFIYFEVLDYIIYNLTVKKVLSTITVYFSWEICSWLLFCTDIVQWVNLSHTSWKHKEI